MAERSSGWSCLGALVTLLLILAVAMLGAGKTHAQARVPNDRIQRNGGSCIVRSDGSIRCNSAPGKDMLCNGVPCGGGTGVTNTAPINTLPKTADGSGNLGASRVTDDGNTVGIASGNGSAALVKAVPGVIGGIVTVNVYSDAADGGFIFLGDVAANGNHTLLSVDDTNQTIDANAATVKASRTTGGGAALTVTGRGTNIVSDHVSGANTTVYTESTTDSGQPYTETTIDQNTTGGQRATLSLFAGPTINDGSRVVVTANQVDTTNVWQGNTHAHTGANLVANGSDLNGTCVMLVAVNVKCYAGPQVRVAAGRSYSFVARLFVSESVAVDGIKLDFLSGSDVGSNPTLSYFQAYGIGYDEGGFVFRNNTTSAATTMGYSTITGNAFIDISGNFTVSATGLFGMRFAQDSHSSGALTLKQGSFLLVEQTTGENPPPP